MDSEQRISIIVGSFIIDMEDLKTPMDIEGIVQVCVKLHYALCEEDTAFTINVIRKEDGAVKPQVTFTAEDKSSELSRTEVLAANDIVVQLCMIFFEGKQPQKYVFMTVSGHEVSNLQKYLSGQHDTYPYTQIIGEHAGSEDLDALILHYSNILNFGVNDVRITIFSDR